MFNKFNKDVTVGLIYQPECQIKQKGSKGGRRVKGQDLEKPLNLTPTERNVHVFFIQAMILSFVIEFNHCEGYFCPSGLYWSDHFIPSVVYVEFSF